MEQGLTRVILAAGMGLWGSAVFAAEMCAPNEEPHTCALIEELNNIHLALAHTEGDRRIVVMQQQADRAWWEKYVAGITEQRQAMSVWLTEYIKGIEEQRQQAATDAATMAARAAEAGKARR